MGRAAARATGKWIAAFAGMTREWVRRGAGAGAARAWRTQYLRAVILNAVKDLKLATSAEDPSVAKAPSG